MMDIIEKALAEIGEAWEELQGGDRAANEVTITEMAEHWNSSVETSRQRLKVLCREGKVTVRVGISEGHKVKFYSIVPGR